MGLPGKLGMEGSEVWGAYQAGKIAEIRNYCETDVVNTYLVFLRFQLMRGALTEQQPSAECAVVRSTLGKSPSRTGRNSSPSGGSKGEHRVTSPHCRYRRLVSWGRCFSRSCSTLLSET